METISFKEPFNREHFIKNQIDLLKIKNKKNLKRLKYYAIFIVVCLIIAALGSISGDTKNPAYILALIFFIIFLISLSLFLLIRRRIINIVYRNAGKMESQMIIGNWEFSNSGIKYWDSRMSVEYKWSSFHSYYIENDLLIISLDDDIMNSFTLRKTDPFFDTFDKVFELVKSKLKVRVLD
jgi:uncharacterized membrane protein YtjA (UPF0391 family)